MQRAAIYYLGTVVLASWLDAELCVSVASINSTATGHLLKSELFHSLKETLAALANGLNHVGVDQTR